MTGGSPFPGPLPCQDPAFDERFESGRSSSLRRTARSLHGSLVLELAAGNCSDRRSVAGGTTRSRLSVSNSTRLSGAGFDSVRPGLDHPRQVDDGVRAAKQRDEVGGRDVGRLESRRANARSGGRRATVTISSIVGSASTDSSTLVPAFPVAPITTTRMTRPYPMPPPRHRRRGFVSWPRVRASGSISLWVVG